jgi:hypothetical protein
MDQLSFSTQRFFQGFQDPPASPISPVRHLHGDLYIRDVTFHITDKIQDTFSVAWGS